MGLFVVTGAASGMGAATAATLRADGHDVLGVDLHGSDLDADLGLPAGRERAVSEALGWSKGRLDGVALFAGLVGLTDRPADLLVSVNYFGCVRLLEGLRPALAASGDAYALVACSNSMTCQPGFSLDLVEACLSDDEDKARLAAQGSDSVAAYPATKTALARWLRAAAPAWAAEGIRLNALAPGRVDTPMIEQTRRDPVLGGAVDAFPVPLGRGGRPEEVADLAAFMLTRASFMAGSIVLVDGGTEALLRPTVYPTPWEI